MTTNVLDAVVRPAHPSSLSSKNAYCIHFALCFFFFIKSNTSAGDVDAVDVLSTSVLIYVSIVVMIDTMAKTINSTVMVRIMVIVSAH